ncbi:glucosaminidase domain-containing protein [Bacillus massilinigeriensis]|uniref:glucosaminidase domain-containing protein n=1 Tax=Bacillus mediterraneensis TaxID=1805474 RepID=UPI0008F84C2F|nr:SH3 domain-containing protein [Bacillus mediterraneensis]
MARTKKLNILLFLFLLLAAAGLQGPGAEAATVKVQGVALKSPTNIYASASTGSKVIKTYAKGTILKYHTYNFSWNKCTVYVNGLATAGYILKSDVRDADTTPVSYQGVALKAPTPIYSKAYTASKVVKTYTKGKILSYQSFVPGWYKAKVYVSGKQIQGYISASDVENAVPSTTSLQVRAINAPTKVYSYASTSATVLKSYSKDTILRVRNFTSSWYTATVYVKGVKKTGYISKSHTSTNLQVDSYLNLDLRKPANITASEIVAFLDRVSPNNPLRNNASSFLAAQSKYGVNAAYLVAHAIWETGWGKSNLMKYKNNLYGYGAYDVCPFTCGYYYPTAAESINAVAYMVRTNYLNPGGPYYHYEHGSTLSGMNVNYAADQNWKNGISNLMERMKPYNSNYYANAGVLPLNSGYPGSYSRDIPAGRTSPGHIIIDFPQGITATVIESAKLRTLPYTSSSTYINTVSATSRITVIGYNTDVRLNGVYPYDYKWYRVATGAGRGWLYGKLIKMDNLLKVTVSSGSVLNIRNAPSGSTVLTSVPSGKYLKAVISGGKPVITDGWYKVYLPNSTETGYVSGDYIKVITR